tara:strand:- start:736 stop:849 length:114 start_codon:yes stop_codon:yes gene_type:complete
MLKSIENYSSFDARITYYNENYLVELIIETDIGLAIL